MKKLLLILLLLPSLTYANYSKEELMHIAFQEGKKIGLPNTVTGMLLQESNAGQMGRIHDNGKTFGVMCIKVSTAKELLRSNEKYDIIRNRLINDDKFNIQVAVKYLKYLLKVFNGNHEKAVLAYNVGLGRVRKHGTKFDPNDYLENVKSKITTYRTKSLFNKYRKCVII